MRRPVHRPARMRHGMAPLGTYTTAMRVGADAAGAVRQRAEGGQGDAGPEPWKKWRRLKLACVGGEVDSCQLATVAVAWIRIFWNGADSMTPINNAEKRPSLALSRFTIPSMVSTS